MQAHDAVVRKKTTSELETEIENVEVVREVAKYIDKHGITYAYDGLRSHGNLPDAKTGKVNNSKTVLHPMHVTKLHPTRDPNTPNGIDLKDVPFPDSRGFRQFLIEDVLPIVCKEGPITSPVPTRVAAHVSTTLRPGVFDAKEKSKFTSATFLYEVVNQSTNSEKSYLCFLWPTNAVSKKDVRMMHVVFSNNSLQFHPIFGERANVFKIPGIESNLQALTAHEIPNEIVDSKLEKALTANGTHVVLIGLKKRPSPEFRYGSAFVGLVMIGAPTSVMSVGDVRSSGYVDPVKFRSLDSSYGNLSKQAVVDNGPQTHIQSGTTEIRYVPIIEDITYHLDTTVVANVGNLDKADYDRKKCAKALAVIMADNSFKAEKSLPLKLLYSLPHTIEKMKKELEAKQFSYREFLEEHDYRLVKDGRLLTDDVYENMFYLDLDVTGYRAKGIVAEINGFDGENIAFYDRRAHSNSQSRIYFDSNMMYKVMQCRYFFREITYKRNAALYDVTGANINFAYYSDLLELMMVRAHGIQDPLAPLNPDDPKEKHNFSDSSYGKGAFLGYAVIKLGLSQAARNKLIEEINKKANSPDAAKIFPVTEEGMQGIAVELKYLHSDSYQALFKDTAQTIFANPGADKAFIETQTIRAYKGEKVFADCATKLVAAIGITNAATIFKDTMQQLADEISCITRDGLSTDAKEVAHVPDVKKVVDLTTKFGLEVWAHRMFPIKPSTYGLTVNAANALAKTIAQSDEKTRADNVLLAAAEESVGLIRKKFWVK